MKIYALACFVLGLSLLWTLEAVPADPAALLFDAFGAQCESQGTFTARALKDTQALQGVLESLLQDPECKTSLTPLLNQVANLEGQLVLVHNGFSDDRLRDLEDYYRKLSIMLTTTSDPMAQQTLATELANTQVELLKYDSEKAQLQRDSALNSMAIFGRYITSLSQIYPNQQLCFERHKLLPLQMALHLGSMAGVFFGPVGNAAAVLGGRLFSALFDYFRDKKFVDAIEKFRGSKLQAGLSCVMESLEKTVCDIQDQRELIALHRKYRSESEIPMEWRGYDLLRRQYKVIQGFLQEVEAGDDPQSDLQGTRRADFRKMEGNYRAVQEKTKGLIGEARRQIRLLQENGSADRAVQQVLRTLVEQLAGVILATQPSIYSYILPTSETYERLDLWLMIGTPSPDISSYAGENPYKAYFNHLQEQPLHLEDMDANLMKIHETARVQLEVSKTLVLNPDLEGALASWTRRGKNSPSAGEIMRDFVAYLDRLEKVWGEHADWFSSPMARRDQMALLVGTRKKFQDSLQALESDAKPAEKVKTIFEAMSLQEQDQVISSRLKRIVEMDLEKRLRHNLFADQKNLEMSIRLAVGDLFSSVSTVSPDFLTKAEQDVNEAEVVAKMNLKNFYDFFRGSLVTSMKELEQESKRWKEGSHGSFREKISKFCVLALNAPQLSEKEFKSLVSMCKDAEVRASVDDKTYRVNFEKSFSAYATQPEKRLCAYRRFRNEVDLRELTQKLSLKK